jgi:hypothetical protein
MQGVKTERTVEIDANLVFWIDLSDDIGRLAADLTDEDLRIYALECLQVALDLGNKKDKEALSWARLDLATA